MRIEFEGTLEEFKQVINNNIQSIKQDSNKATDKQIKLLKNLKIKFPEDITKFEAKKLIEMHLPPKK